MAASHLPTRGRPPNYSRATVRLGTGILMKCRLSFGVQCMDLLKFDPFLSSVLFSFQMILSVSFGILLLTLDIIE